MCGTENAARLGHNGSCLRERLILKRGVDMLYSFNDEEKKLLSKMVDKFYLMAPNKTEKNLSILQEKIRADKLNDQKLAMLADLFEKAYKSADLLSDFGDQIGKHVAEDTEDLKPEIRKAQKILAERGFGTYSVEKWEMD